MRVEVLGQVAVVGDSGRAPVTAAQEQVLLAALTAAAGAAVSAGRLIDTIWGGEPPASASAALKALVHRVRRRYGRHMIVTATSGYQLGPDVDTDLNEVRHLFEYGSTRLAAGDTSAAIAACQDAANLFRGDPPMALAETAAGLVLERQLSELRTGLAELHLDARLAAGEGKELIGELEAAVEADPLAEPNWERLMIALYRSGRQAAALGAFARARAALIEHAGLEPGPALVEVEQRILSQDAALMRESSSLRHEAKGGDSKAPPASGFADVGWFHASAPLTGRDAEMVTIETVLDEALSTRRRQILLISGDPGTGKTRLAGELVNRAAATGTTAAYGSCDPGVAGGYRPFAMAIDRLTSLFPDALAGYDLSAAARIAPVLSDRYQLHSDDGLTLDEVDDQQRLHAGFGRLLNELAGERGLVLVLDDLHWAAPPSLALLRYIADDPTPAALTIVGTYRPRDLTEVTPLTAVLPGLHRDPRITHLRLERLSRSSIRELLETSADQPVPDEIADAVADATGGNPFLVVSTLRHLTDADLVVRREGRWELTAGALDRLPAGIRHLISQQLATLPPEASTLLQFAAVTGMTFGLEATAAVAGISNDSAWIHRVAVG